MLVTNPKLPVIDEDTDLKSLSDLPEVTYWAAESWEHKL